MISIKGIQDFVVELKLIMFLLCYIDAAGTMTNSGKYILEKEINASN